MKSILTLFLCILLFSNTRAQFTLTSSTHGSAIGQTLTYYFQNSPGFDIFGPSGANQIWDISGASSGSPYNWNTLSLSASNDPSSFPDANVVWSDGSNERYMKVSNSGLEEVGTIPINNGKIVYSDGREYLTFPMSFNDDDTSTFDAVFTTAQGLSLNRSGTVRNIVDGYGDLIMPYDTVKNVLRVLQVANYQDESGGTVIANYTDSVCFWYNESNDIYIAVAAKIFWAGTLVGETITYIDQSDLLSIQNRPLQNSPYSLYPNPNHGQLTIENPTQEKLSIDIYNIVGSIVYSADRINGTQVIDISDLAKGNYIIKCSDSESCYIEKLTLQ